MTQFIDGKQYPDYLETEEIAVVFDETETGDLVDVGVDGTVIAGRVGVVRKDGKYRLVQPGDQRWRLKVEYYPSEPDVGIPRPYPENGGIPKIYGLDWVEDGSLIDGIATV